jgi:CDP-diacylglycerol--glycerol-3-phosphate 3-phosphatidyltransferase
MPVRCVDTRWLRAYRERAMLRQLPNTITLVRLAAVPLLAWLAWDGARQPFATVLVACLLGDVVDGALARLMHATSPFGAQLDSVADSLLFFTTIAGTLVFHPDDVRAHALAFALVPAAWLAENCAALIRYGRLSSFHTYLSRAAGVAMGLFVAVLFLHGMDARLLHAAVALVLLATLEEFALLWTLPAWTANVRGLYWVLRRRA